MRNIFRECYTFPNDITWFPGHMTRALKTVKKLCHNVDIMLEVRDARIPVSSVNPSIERALVNKPKLILLHRSDLITKSDQKRISAYFKQRNEKVLFTSTITESNMNAIIPALLAIKPSKFVSVGSYFAVMGIPNVGKSSVIRYLQKSSNDFLNKKSPLIGGVPGVTKRVEATKVHNRPDIYMYDTPGIFLPSIDDPEVGLKLALCGSVKDSVVGEEEIADYLLFYMNRNGYFGYAQELGILNPTDNLVEILTHISRKTGKDQLSASRLFIRKYREGKYGLFILDTFNSFVFLYQLLVFCSLIHINRYSRFISINQTNAIH